VIDETNMVNLVSSKIEHQEPVVFHSTKTGDMKLENDGNSSFGEGSDQSDGMPV